jgi:uncharacterized protein
MAERDESGAIPGATVDWVERVHAVVDELVAPIVVAHGARLRCRSGCHDCCSDGLSVFAIEAAVIERHHRTLLDEGTAAPSGGCAFLDEAGACRIYEHRPYVCRTQGLPLRWLEERAEVRDVCPLNSEGGPPLEELPVEQCWTLGPIEERLSSQQGSIDGGAGQRVALRSLFASSSQRRLPILR